MMAVMLRLTLMSLIVGNSFKFTTLVRISADTIRIVYEMRPCADILSVDPPDGIRMASGEHCYYRRLYRHWDSYSSTSRPYPTTTSYRPLPVQRARPL
jgi:hypothetical protein